VAIEPDTVAFPLVGNPRFYVAYGVARAIDGGTPSSTNELLVWARDWSRLDITLAQARAASFGLRSLTFLTRSGIRLEIGQAAGLVIALLVVFSLIALAAATAILAASAASEVQRRLSAIGVLRALGASRRAIVAGHAAEAALIALPAAALGLALGWLAVRAGTNSLLVALSELAPDWTLFLVLVGALAGLVCVVAAAAAFPAARAARRPPVDALRGADVVAPPHRLPLPAGARGLGVRLLLARPFRAATAVTVLAVSGAFALLMLSMATLLANLQSDPHAIGRAYQISISAPTARLLEIRRLRGVVDAGVRYETWATDSFDLGESFKVVALDAGHQSFEAPPLTEGRRVQNAREADVGLGLAQALELHPGATLPVQLENGREVRFRVVGVVRALTEQGRLAYVTPRRLVAAEPSLEPTIAIKTENGASGRVERELAARGLGWSSSAGVSGEGVQGWATRNSGFVSVLVALLRVIAVIDGLVCVYALGQVLALTATERRQALAVIRALGAGRAQVRRVFSTAALGTAIAAAPVAILLERELVGPLVARLAAPYASISLSAGLWPVLAVVCALVVSALAAGAIVARRAAAVPVTDALSDV
jgi:ABC-type lipoprotein release transport system permease subunit